MFLQSKLLDQPTHSFYEGIARAGVIGQFHIDERTLPHRLEHFLKGGNLLAAIFSEKKLPASRERSSLNERSLTRPRPPVVRSTVLSWITTARPSAESLTSNSIASAFCASASSKAASVFSGA